MRRVAVLVMILAVGCAPAAGTVIDARAPVVEQTTNVVIQQPVAGATVTSPLTVSGTADVFEAEFRIQLVDASGNVIVDQGVHASCGTGCQGTFSTTLHFSAVSGNLKLVAYELSAKDGSRVDLDTVAVVGSGAIPPTL